MTELVHTGRLVAPRGEGWGGSAVLPSQYTGFVATGTAFPNFLASAGALKQANEISRHKITEDLNALQVVYESSYVNASFETSAGNADVIAAITDTNHALIGGLQFSGVAQGLIPGGGRLVSDILVANIPRGTEIFHKRWTNLAGSGNPVWVQATTGNFRNEAAGERLEAAASGLSDRTQSGASFTSNQVTSLRGTPAAIIGLTRRGTVLVFGTSRCLGRANVPDATLAVGNICIKLAANLIGHANFGITGETIQAFRASSAKRRDYAKYASHAVFEHAINDTFSGRTAAQIKTDLEAVIPLTKAVMQAPARSGTCAVEPRLTTHNSGVPATGEGERVIHNNNSRGLLIAGQDFHIELADQVEQARDNGLWADPNDESDGVHELLVGATKASNGVNVAEFAR